MTKPKNLFPTLLVAIILHATVTHAATKGEMMGVFTDLRDAKTAPQIKALGLGWVRIMYHFWTLKDDSGAQKANALEGWEGVFDVHGTPKASVDVIKARAARSD